MEFGLLRQEVWWANTQLPRAGLVTMHIADEIIRHRNRAPAILLANHGVFTFDTTVRKTFKAAVMVEDVAKTLWLAAQLGEPRALSADEIAKWWDRYHSTYGQASTELGG